MTLSTPIKLTLYDENDEPVETYSRARITTAFLERAIEISEAFNAQTDPKTVLSAVDQLLVDFYGGRFTLEQARQGGDVTEKMAVIMAIVNRASGIVGDLSPEGAPNPT